MNQGERMKMQRNNCHAQGIGRPDKSVEPKEDERFGVQPAVPVHLPIYGRGYGGYSQDMLRDEYGPYRDQRPTISDQSPDKKESGS
jgi:hypothetical protein